MFLTQLSPLILPLLRRVPTLYHVVWLRPICPQGTKMLPDGHLCTSPAGRVCYRAGCVPIRDWLPVMFQLWLWKRWRRAFRIITANSEATRQQLISEGIAPITVIRNGIPAPPTDTPPGAVPTAVFAGRLIREKGVDVLLEAFARVLAVIPSARLIIAGDGPERGRLQQGQPDAVSFRGFLASGEMEREFAGAWVQVVPSRCADSFPSVAIEAMMRGTAVVASRIGGLPEIVQEERTGWLVPPNDAAALATAMTRVLQNRELAEQLGKAGREVALAQFSEEVFLNRFVSVYRALAPSQ